MAADPGTGARVGPDLRGDLVLLLLGAALRRAVAAVHRPGRGKDLIGPAGAARGVEGAVVATRLARDDVGGDREGAAQPSADLLLGGRRIHLLRLLDLARPAADVAAQGAQGRLL